MSELAAIKPVLSEGLKKGFAYIMNLAGRKVENSVKQKQWRQLFSASGDNVIRHMEREGDFTEDLVAIFSKENMEKIAERMEGEHGFSFPQVLHDEMYSLLRKYEIDEDAAETYICFFTEQIIEYVSDNDPEKRIEMYLGELKASSEKEHKDIEGRIDELLAISKQEDSGIESLQDIEKKMEERALFNINLDFFELDDDSFKVRFDKAIRQQEELVLIEGKSKEETLYRVLNEIKHTFPEIKTWIIKNRTEWEKAEKYGFKGCILIPFFNFEDAVAIKGNACIYIYNEEVPCRSRDKIILKKRTKRNLVKSLENVGMDHAKAYHLVENTHGLYASLKHKLFRIPPSTLNPQWVNECSNIILSALLLGKWSDIGSDRDAFKAMTGEEYNKCFRVLQRYEHSEQPFVIKTEVFGGYYYQIASIEEAWELLKASISDDLWKRFLDLAVIVLGKHNPNNENQFGYRDTLQSVITNNSFSRAMEKGILRTFVLCRCFTEDIRKRRQIDFAVSTILDTLENQNDWESISGYLPDLCEAAPRPVMARLEKEMKHSTGMLDLFHQQSGYIDILWTIELLVQLNDYRARAIGWLWELNDRDIEYKNGNTPKDTLERIFCAWFYTTALRGEEKIQEARKAVDRYKNAWFVIASCLPNNDRFITPFYTPEFMDIDEPEAAYTEDANNIFYSYLQICVEAAKGDTEKWTILIKALPNYDIQIQREVLQDLIDVANDMDDKGKAAIQFELRKLIYHHRRYSHSDWAMSDDCIQLFEDANDRLIYADPIYDYLYIFAPKYEFPLLHPISYTEDEFIQNDADTEEQQIDKEIALRMQEFKGKGLSIIRLIESATILNIQDRRIGFVIAHYYDRDEFNSDTYTSLLQNKEINDLQVYYYARTVVGDSLPQLRTILKTTKENGGSNALIADIISLQIVKNTTNCLIFHESDEIKKEFWGKTHDFVLSIEAEPQVLQEAIRQCLMYGTLETYVEFLFDNMERISTEELYKYCLSIEKVLDRSNDSTSIEWYIQKILGTLQECYIDDEEKSYHIARLEWLFGDLIQWDQMKCLRKWLESDPRIYAYLVDIVCRKDHEDKSDPDKQKRASRMYNRFKSIHFCPAEKKGEVDYIELRRWTDKFNNLLQEQDQISIYETILGNLLTYSPRDEDGYVPCKAVCQLIEETYNEDLSNAFETTIINQRGIYSPDGGKSELVLANRFSINAKKLTKAGYPHTAQIYRDLKEYYEQMAARERKEAEDEW